MEEETMENQNNTLYYIIGAVVLVAVIGAGYLLRPKPTTAPAPQAAGQAVPITTPNTAPISKLVCDTQYYNPVIAFPRYYFSVEGGDVAGATKVDCKFSMTQENKIVATEAVSTSQLTAKPERNGNVFKCTSSSLELKPNVPTKVDVVLTDDKDAKATCSSLFLLPKP
jgi:hypothetical protein